MEPIGNNTSYNVAEYNDKRDPLMGACMAFQAPVQPQPNSLYAPDSPSLTDEQRRTSVFS